MDNQIKNKYLVVITSSFIRDVQIAPDKYINALCNDEDVESIDYVWDCADSGEYSIGIYEGFVLDEALEEASYNWTIDKKALKGYELK